MKVTITENGNGFPNEGALVYDSSANTVYKIVSFSGYIQTNGCGAGNSIEAEVEEVGYPSDLDDDEWESIESLNCGVVA